MSWKYLYTEWDYSDDSVYNADDWTHRHFPCPEGFKKARLTTTSFHNHKQRRGCHVEPHRLSCLSRSQGIEPPWQSKEHQHHNHDVQSCFAGVITLQCIVGGIGGVIKYIDALVLGIFIELVLRSDIGGLNGIRLPRNAEFIPHHWKWCSGDLYNFTLGLFDQFRFHWNEP